MKNCNYCWKEILWINDRKYRKQRYCNTECRNKYYSKPEMIYKAWYNSMRTQKKTVSISFEEWYNLINLDCNYCWWKWWWIDRFDNNKWYHIENCVPSCRSCNQLKFVYSIDELKDHITRMYNKIVLWL